MRRTRIWHQDIHGPPEAVFPLLCPVREHDWVPGWQAETIYSESGVAELEGVFTTTRPDKPTSVWTVTRYEPPRHVAYFRVTPGLETVHLDIEVRPAAPGRSKVAIRYTWTGLGPEGDARIEAYTDDDWARMMTGWERSMNHYLATGEKLAE